MTLRNIANYLSDTVSHLRILECSAALL